MIRIFIWCFLLFPPLAHADLGAAYCVKGTVVTRDNKTYTGYFRMGGYDFSVEKGEDGHYRYHALEKTGLIAIEEAKPDGAFVVAHTERQFFSDAMATLPDTFSVFPDALLIPFAREGDPVPAYLGAANVIARKNIQEFRIESLRPCSILYDVYTPLSAKDRWISGKVHLEESLGQPDCLYFAFYYSAPTAASTALVKSFQLWLQEMANSPETIGQRQKAIREKLEALKREKVLIVYTCSC